MEISTGVLNEQEKKVLTGEALALRAFLHLDMLRLFGPVYVKNPSAEAIPYNESDKVSALPILAADTVMGRVLRDINAAEQLLKGNDPVIEQGGYGFTGRRSGSVLALSSIAIQLLLLFWH